MTNNNDPLERHYVSTSQGRFYRGRDRSKSACSRSSAALCCVLVAEVVIAAILALRAAQAVL